MTDLNLSDRVLVELNLAETVILPVAPNPLRWELWISFAAAVSAIVVVAGVLLTLTAELRAGWVPGHELPMDKAAAIHKLLFRP